MAVAELRSGRNSVVLTQCNFGPPLLSHPGCNKRAPPGNVTVLVQEAKRQKGAENEAHAERDPSNRDSVKALQSQVRIEHSNGMEFPTVLYTVLKSSAVQNNNLHPRNYIYKADFGFSSDVLGGHLNGTTVSGAL
eukprot:5520665-Amphidinium_carterae.1